MSCDKVWSVDDQLRNDFIEREVAHREGKRDRLVNWHLFIIPCGSYVTLKHSENCLIDELFIFPDSCSARDSLLVATPLNTSRVMDKEDWASIQFQFITQVTN